MEVIFLELFFFFLFCSVLSYLTFHTTLFSLLCFLSSESFNCLSSFRYLQLGFQKMFLLSIVWLSPISRDSDCVLFLFSYFFWLLWVKTSSCGVPLWGHLPFVGALVTYILNLVWWRQDNMHRFKVDEIKFTNIWSIPGIGGMLFMSIPIDLKFPENGASLMFCILNTLVWISPGEFQSSDHCSSEESLLCSKEKW